MRRRNPGPSNRAVRVSEQIHHELAELIRADVKDPRIGLVTVTGLDLTPDYAHATVWFTVLPDDADTLERTLRGLRAAAGYLRTQLGRRVRIHTTPELRFSHDPSTSRGIAVSQLIDRANSVRADDSDEEGEGVQHGNDGADTRADDESR